MVAGTSTGGILATALVSRSVLNASEPYYSDEILTLFKE